MGVTPVSSFEGFHSEWNLGSPGGWDYQRIAQVIGKTVWERISAVKSVGVDLDFDHAAFYPIDTFVDMLIGVYRKREGNNPGLIAVVAEEEALADVTEDKNLAAKLGAFDGIKGVLCAPQHLESRNGVTCFEDEPVSLVFMDFNTDVLIDLHRKHDLSPLLRSVSENRVINPRGTEPINVKSMFEVITGDARDRFHPEIVRRTPWTRRFFPRKSVDPAGKAISDLVEWTRANWEGLVLKPERGYSGKGVHVGGVHHHVDDIIAMALEKGDYILQEKVPLNLWAEEMPEWKDGGLAIEVRQTDFRCMISSDGLVGFLGRYGGVPTNVGSGGGVQPLAILRSAMTVKEAVNRVNDALAAIPPEDLEPIVKMKEQLAVDHRFTYLLGPTPIALRPRIMTEAQVTDLAAYSEWLWKDCLTLEKMWHAGELDGFITIEEEELAIARMQPWKGGPAIIAADGLFNFGANL